VMVAPASDQEVFLEAGGLRHHLTVWDGGGTTTVLFLHGWLDLGRTWTATIEALPPGTDWHCVALDWRGHGQTDRCPPASYYHFADYVRDLDLIARRVRRDRFVVVAHSMGAQVASLWCGARPDQAAGLVMVEGLGPPATSPTEYVRRMATWLDETSPYDLDRFDRPMQSMDHAVARIHRAEPRIPADRVKKLAEWATVTGPDGLLRWRYDPLHRTHAPVPMPLEAGLEFWRHIAVPVLWVGGAQSPWTGPELDKRIALLPRGTRQRIPGAGHAVQNDAPEALATLIAGFVGSLG
jgi:pimeloyl-ACP methyl ester carboxylesterase